MWKLKDLGFGPRGNWLYDLFKVLRALSRWDIIKDLRYKFSRYWQFHITLKVLYLFKTCHIKQSFRPHLLEVFLRYSEVIPKYYGCLSKYFWAAQKDNLCHRVDFNLLIFIVLNFYSYQPMAPISWSHCVRGCPRDFTMTLSQFPFFPYPARFITNLNFLCSWLLGYHPSNG